MSGSGPSSWLSGWHWRERINNFTPSWFTICMGTGTVSQILVNFPYPYTGGTYWMRNLAYCFWILDIVLFGIFTAFLVIRYIRHPILMKKTVMEFPTCSYLGAIPIALDTIITGISSFYNYRDSGRWTAYGLWWFNVALTLLVCVGLLIVQMTKQEEHAMSDVAGLWLMTCVPMVITAALGATLLPYLSWKTGIACLVVSFLLWTSGLVLIHLILACYFWRLISHHLPAQQLLGSGFLPMAPLSQGAFAAQQFSIYLSNYLSKKHYAPTQSHPPPLSPQILEATGEAIHWLGIIVSLFLLAHATFWFIQATAAMLIGLPKKFNIGLWSLVFPIGAYCNGWEVLSRDLRNDGMRGWSATVLVLVSIIWLFCALCTVYLGFWKGELFFAPGLEDWLYKEKDDEQQNGEQSNGRRISYNGTYRMEKPKQKDEENGNGNANGSQNGTQSKERND
ncbi:uncharacterized protein K452DRAFT_354559 [Aplosporella prunicola CBS 121167]|uniref:C4-dicarboxylate transporter/malic acid transport protein n=1 Tax=Aplosporella prunicola CBS 121167 TaxID=1176127 RepID=A0A6A6BSL2_9PEZI|nr:uncharacterized protein K452DRAFT_354559 [Aplosporella prunicola CBS 121167]KAF2147092.1 hypothetical protein K452DRAFT_354559 [Aplosporella prunicola CBS 121167]